MPARKQSSLNRRHDTKEDKGERESVEKALQPTTDLPVVPPNKLKGHAVACETWTQVIMLQAETQAAKDGNPIITSFDEKSLIDFCLLVEEEFLFEQELTEIRAERSSLISATKRMKLTGKNVDVWLARWKVINAIDAKIVKLDARLDGKRKLKVSLARDLYLTPRSRAGVAPQGSTPTEEPDAMGKLLNGSASEDNS